MPYLSSKPWLLSLQRLHSSATMTFSGHAVSLRTKSSSYNEHSMAGWPLGVVFRQTLALLDARLTFLIWRMRDAPHVGHVRSGFQTDCSTWDNRVMLTWRVTWMSSTPASLVKVYLNSDEFRSCAQKYLTCTCRSRMPCMQIMSATVVTTASQTRWARKCKHLLSLWSER